MDFNEAIEAIRDAEATMNRADTMASGVARLLVGRLRKVTSGHALQKLKRELQDFNSTTLEWKD